MIQSINPFTGDLLKEFIPHDSDTLRDMVLDAEATYQEWRTSTFSQRKNCLLAAAKELQRNKEHYALLITQEMGKVIGESRVEIEKCAQVCSYYAAHGEAYLTPLPLKLDNGSQAQIRYQPLGVILAIMPWNFPFWQVFRFAAPTLMAGNAALLKHASNVPQCALAIQSILEKAGFPKGLFQTVLIDAPLTQKLIAFPQVKAISLTGSEKAGAAVAAEAGKHIKKTLLELGGSDPFIVLEDADLELAATAAVKSRMINTGQSCIAAKRFIVLDSIYEAFAEKLKEKFLSLRRGDPTAEDSDYACLARPDLAWELFKQVEESIRCGAEVLLGGSPVKEGSAYVEPTLLTAIPKNAPAYSEELFGPVGLLFSVQNEQEAIELANDTRFGLGASIWTSSQERAAALADQLECGAVFFNAFVASHPHLPFGGVKQSGYGRELGKAGILEFVNQQTLYLG